MSNPEYHWLRKLSLVSRVPLQGGFLVAPCVTRCHWKISSHGVTGKFGARAKVPFPDAVVSLFHRVERKNMVVALSHVFQWLCV